MTIEMVRDGYRLAREVHLALKIFNLSAAGIIFSHKLLSLCGGIVGLYFLLRLILFQPLLSLFFFALAFDSIVFYTVIWDNACLIPVLMKEMKNQFDMAAAVVRAVNTHQYWRSVSRSIPCIGVSVGGFRGMERDSTPILVEFVVRNVVSLLMTFN